MKTSTKTVLLLSFILSLIVGAFFLYITYDHNPQCEFHCDGVINWANWLPYGIIYALFSFILFLAMGFIIKFLIERYSD